MALANCHKGNTRARVFTALRKNYPELTSQVYENRALLLALILLVTFL
jgi:hypothetical protein